jgi:predicted nucleotidyltransferase
MKTIDDLPIKQYERRAIIEAARLLKDRFSAREVILFGSKARGDDDEESDIDLLVLTSQPVSWNERKAINDYTLYLNLALRDAAQILRQARYSFPLECSVPQVSRCVPLHSYCL